MTGTIKKLVGDRHFGFIHATNGQDIFFHASGVAQNAFTSLSVGQTVQFDLERTEKGPKAANVRVESHQELS